MPAQVNLDALIPREDFEVLSTGQTEQPDATFSVKISELEQSGFFYNALRKPDFQRETAEWDPQRVVGLIRTFIEDDLIPAVILWKNRDLLFVIDGSHRLSALIAWVQNDYGDGPKSQQFFDHVIPEEQKKIANRTREMVEKEFGSYVEHKNAIANPTAFGPDIVARARKFGSLSLRLQWVRGDASKAEESFVRINQRAVTIDPQELELLKSRRKPNTIAARAIIRRGTGHQYWSSFGQDEQTKIKEISIDIHKLMFSPALHYPIKSLDLPAGGSVYSAPALRMVYDFVTLAVGAPSPDEDRQGERTIEYLIRTRRVMRLLLSHDPSSLGLHPAVYFYSWTGTQQPILFLTIASIIIEFERSNKLREFIRIRRGFEKFLMTNRSLLNQVIRKFGTKSSGAKHLRAFYLEVIKLLDDGIDAEQVAATLRSQPQFSYLQPNETPYDGVAPTRYSTSVKAGLVMKTMLETAVTCPICGGVVPPQSISVDHIDRAEDGGLATVENAQITHPYCNTGFKENQHAASRKLSILPSDAEGTASE
jgi:hypothetical protein